mmetsp:Transcript_134428/g.190032  ORF Transcript_134428/g.190032 Transcript_134428/m.190032 type:complete len:234 (-) Transcript_134428:30-731(-)
MWAPAPTGSPLNVVFVCDLTPQLTETDLRHVFAFYGEIVSVEHIDEASGGSALVTYTTAEAAAEAAQIVHLALVRGKTCRCLLWSTVEAIWATMESGQRLQVEGLDPKIHSLGLQDIFALFGNILDCKVQTDESEKSRGYGFVHFAEKEPAMKAISLLNGMQIGSSTIQVREAKSEDRELYTGCLYSLSTAVSAVCPTEEIRPIESDWMGPSHDTYHSWEGADYENWKQPQMS